MAKLAFHACGIVDTKRRCSSVGQDCGSGRRDETRERRLSKVKSTSTVGNFLGFAGPFQGLRLHRSCVATKLMGMNSALQSGSPLKIAAYDLARDTPSADLENPVPPPVWSEERWKRLEANVRRVAMESGRDDVAWDTVARAARVVMATFTTSFFVASRFLPRPQRRIVEVIYAAVRYPDEVTDSFPLTPRERLERLDRWAAGYEVALRQVTVLESLAAGVSPFLAAFVDVVRRTGIPPDSYRAFLAAMRYDVEFQLFETMDELIERYIAGSAIAVGVFLTHVYGAESSEVFPEALRSSRHLAIGLQLTNFARDVVEDARRGRWYLPMDTMRRHGAVPFDLFSPRNRDAIRAAVREIAEHAEAHYRHSERGLDAFSAKCRPAIRACLELYRKLNSRIQEMPDCLAQRASLTWREKWAVLPASKYVRIPFMRWL